MVGSNALLSVCLDVCDLLTKIIWGTASHMVLKFGQGMHVDDLEVVPEGHRSKVKVTRSKKRDFRSHFTVLQAMELS